MITMCSSTAAMCMCSNPLGHDGAHGCHCGAIWEGTWLTANWRGVRMPNTNPDWQPTMVVDGG